MTLFAGVIIALLAPSLCCNCWPRQVWGCHALLDRNGHLCAVRVWHSQYGIGSRLAIGNCLQRQSRRCRQTHFEWKTLHLHTGRGSGTASMRWLPGPTLSSHPCSHCAQCTGRACLDGFNALTASSSTTGSPLLILHGSSMSALRPMLICLSCAVSQCSLLQLGLHALSKQGTALAWCQQ